MREIKFRAWDKINETMHHNVHRVDSFNEKLSRPNEYDVMQFTGLHDKNGVEIFEGDKCNVLFANGETHRAVVCFIDGCFELNFYYPVVIAGHYNDRDYLKCSVGNHAVEIIGNIHEHPDLLK